MTRKRQDRSDDGGPEFAVVVGGDTADSRDAAFTRHRANLAFAILCLAAFAILLAAYSNFFRNAFHFDDSHVIVENAYIRSLHDIPRFFTDARTFSSLPSNATWRPLLTLSFAIDYRLSGGLDPFWFHVTQFSLLVLLGALLVLFFLKLMNDAAPRPANRWAALVGATIFCVHTVNTETLNLISARSDLVSTLAVVLAFVLYTHSPLCRRYHLYLLPVAVGALAKAPVVFFAPLLFSYLMIFGEEKNGRRVPLRARDAFRLSLPAIIAGVALLWLLDRMNHPDWTPGSFDRMGYLRTQPFVWLHYLRLFFLPLGLTADTDMGIIPHWHDTRVIAGLVTIAVLCFVVWKLSSRRTMWPASFGLAWFAIALLPASSVFPLAEVANEHRVFFPYIGLSLAVVWSIAVRLCGETPRQRRAAIGFALIAVVVIASLAVGTYSRNRVWKSEESLWLDVTRKSPGNGRGLMNYGQTQMAQGRFDVARDYFERASRLTPNYPVLEINLGIVESATGNRAKAEAHFRRALALSPDVKSHFYYARWLIDVGRGPEAVDHLREAIRLSPGAANAREMLMSVYAARGSADELRRLAAETLSIDAANRQAAAHLQGRFFTDGAPDYESLFAAGLDAGRADRAVSAARAFRDCVTLRPEAADAWNNLGYYLGKAGFRDEAQQALGQALVLRPDFELARNNLTWVLQQAYRAGAD